MASGGEYRGHGRFGPYSAEAYRPAASKHGLAGRAPHSCAAAAAWEPSRRWSAVTITGPVPFDYSRNCILNPTNTCQSGCPGPR